MLNSPKFFAAILVVQIVCAVFFVAQIALSVFGLPYPPISWQLHELIEIGAAVGLTLGVCLGALAFNSARRRARQAEDALRAASGELMELINERFDEWSLTPAERDVALFALKGLSLSDIARLRATSEGTVKAQSAAVYRKAGVSGRPQLISLFVEDLMDIPAPS